MFTTLARIFSLTQAKLGQMAADVDAGALLTYTALPGCATTVRRGSNARVTAEPGDGR